MLRNEGYAKELEQKLKKYNNKAFLEGLTIFYVIWKLILVVLFITGFLVLILISLYFLMSTSEPGYSFFNFSLSLPIIVGIIILFIGFLYYRGYKLSKTIDSSATTYSYTPSFLEESSLFPIVHAAFNFCAITLYSIFSFYDIRKTTDLTNEPVEKYMLTETYRIISTKAPLTLTEYHSLPELSHINNVKKEEYLQILLKIEMFQLRNNAIHRFDSRFESSNFE